MPTLRGAVARVKNRLDTVARRLAPKLVARVAQSAVQRRLERQRRPLAELSLDPRPVIVFFAPEAGLVPYFMAHCLLAKTLQERGHRILVIRCHDIYPRCTVMESHRRRLDMSLEERRASCHICGQASVEMDRRYGLDTIDLRDVLSVDLRDAIAREVKELPADLSTVEVDGIRFGQICSAEASVALKVVDFTGADPGVRALFVRYLEGALLSYRAMQQLIASLKVARLVYFSEYAMLLGTALAARRAGIPTTNLILGQIRAVDARRVSLMPQLLAIESYRERLQQWPMWRRLALSAAAVDDIAEDALFRISSNSAMVYSPARNGAVDDLAARLELSPHRRVLLAFTSSLDEVSANNYLLAALGLEPFSADQPFADQIEWLEALIAHVESSDELQLVVRIHPREGENRRDKVASRHLEVLRARFNEPYKHSRFIWPGEPVSSYDLMEIADVGLTAWSSTAVEMARFGIPVVIAFNLHTPIPLDDVVTWANTPDGYFKCIEQALKSAPSLTLIRLTYRWLNLRISGHAVDLSDVVPSAAYWGLPSYRTPGAAGIVEDALVSGRNMLDINREQLVARQREGSEKIETAALLRQLRRLIWFLSLGEQPLNDYRLRFASASVERLPDDCDALVAGCGEGVEFRTRNRVARRQSQIVKRLAMLAAENAFEYVEG
jgi:hypothetical protein